MILIGQYDSPYVRRVAIALRLYDVAYEHRPWSVFGDAERVAAFNPLKRVPILVRDDGEALIETTAILDHLDEEAGTKALMARSGAARRQALKVCALASGVADKAVSLVYEHALHAQVSHAWAARLTEQIRDTLDALEADRAARATPYWFGAAIGHADIAVACALRFVHEAHPALFAGEGRPALADHAAACEALAPFRQVVQPFIPPR